MPSALNPCGTSIVLINCMVLTSNIEGWGWSLVKPWPVFGHTVAPLPPTPGITPIGSSVSRSKIVTRFSNAGTAGVVAVAADLRGLEHLVRAVGLPERDRRERRDGRRLQQNQSSHGHSPHVSTEY